MQPKNKSRRSADPLVRSGDASRTERLLMLIPILLFATVGLGLGLTRFILAIRENLQEPASDWISVLFLVAMVGGVALLILFASTAVGVLVGLLLKLIVTARRAAGGF